jgi:hypothetical protein
VTDIIVGCSSQIQKYAISTFMTDKASSMTDQSQRDTLKSTIAKKLAENPEWIPDASTEL